MRVGLVTTSYPRFEGDPAGGFVAEHARFLEEAGYRVEVVAAGERKEAGVTGSAQRATRRVPSAGLFYGGGGPEALEGGAWREAAEFTARMTVEVARCARRWDAIVCHWLVPSALAAMAVTRKPILAIAHSGDVHTLRRIGALPAFAAIAAARPGLRLSFVSRELERLFLAAAPGPLRRRLAARSQVCPMGLEVGRLRSLRRAAGGRAQVLFLGRLVPIKGAAIAAIAAGQWRSDARLVIAGAGPDAKHLQALAASAPAGRIELVGEAHGPRRDELLAASDIVVIPSVPVNGRGEGTPLAALEAMAAGAAVVASNLGGLAEIPAIARVTPGDPDALAREVDRLIASPQERASQVAAQWKAVQEYAWSRVGPRLLPCE